MKLTGCTDSVDHISHIHFHEGLTHPRNGCISILDQASLVLYIYYLFCKIIR